MSKHKSKHKSKHRPKVEQDWNIELANSLRQINAKWTPSIIDTDPDWKKAKTIFSALEKYFAAYDKPECANRCGDLIRLTIGLEHSNAASQNLVSFIESDFVNGDKKPSFVDMSKYIDENSPNNRRGSRKVHDNPTSQLKDALTRLDKLYNKYHVKVEELNDSKLNEEINRFRKPDTKLLKGKRDNILPMERENNLFRG